MVCQQLDELEWDFIQAREESPDLDSLGWTDREFACLDAILDHKRDKTNRMKGMTTTRQTMTRKTMTRATRSDHRVSLASPFSMLEASWLTVQI
jgi:hypothetical protein